MVTSPLAFVLYPLAIFMLLKGLSVLQNTSGHKKNMKEAERIFRQRVITSEDKVIEELIAHFAKIKKSIYVSAGYFLFSFMLVFVSFFLMKNSDTPSPPWLVFLVTLVIYLIPISIVSVASLDLKMMKEDILGRFTPDN